MTHIRNRLLATTAVSLLMAGLAPAAMAQAPADETAAAEPVEIVVTGSRIRRKDFVAESPIMTLTADVIAQKGPATLDSALTAMPQFSASSGSATQGGANASARGSRANLNLRGLGIARTLVLLDGRRIQPSDPLGNAVDLNTIPSNIIGNVEIISGGASAVYGSDAVAGVVNLITRRNFTGMQVDAQYGQTELGDGETADVSVLLGGKFAENRGHALFSFSFFDRKAAYMGERDYFRGTGDTNAPPQGRFTPTGTNLPSQAALTTLFGSYGVTGTPAASAALSINRDGTLFSTGPAYNLRLGAADGFGMARDGSGLVTAFTPYESGLILNPLRRHNVYSKIDYRLNDAVTAYAIVNYTSYESHNQQRGTLNGTSPVATVPVTNPFIPTDLAFLLASRPNPTASFNYSFFGDRVAPKVFTYEYQVAQVTGGLKGALPYKDWNWDASASYGKTSFDFRQTGNISIAALQTLLNAPDGGASVCAGGFRIFDFAPVSPECSAYVARTLKESTTLEQTTADLSIDGGLFELPAGEVRFAGGLGLRNTKYTFVGDDQQIQSLVYFSRPVQNSGGSESVREIYGELLVPVLRDLPLIRSFDLNTAYRYSDYNSVGGVSAYKLTADWEMTDFLRWRGGYQRAVRAPSVGELFGGGRSVSSAIGSTASGQGDPCDITSTYRLGAASAQVRDLCIAQGVPAGTIDSYRFTGTTVTTSQLGNSQLKAETADTYTLGAVMRWPGRSPLMSGLTVSVDYYNIEVSDAIGNITTAVSLQRCFNADGSNPTYAASNYFCSLIRRDAAGTISFPLEPALNLSSYKTDGVDMLIDYKYNFEGYGKLGVSSAISYVNSYKIQVLAGGAYVDYVGTVGNTQIDQFTSTHPKWKAQTTVSWDIDPVSLALTWNHTGAVENATNVLNPAAKVRGVDATDYYDLSARWKLRGNLELRAGIQNVTNADLPIGPTPGAADLSAYDALGRRFSIGFNARF